MTERHAVAPVDAFADRDRVIAEIEGREIAVFAVDDAFHAVLNFCVHEGGPLCEGDLAGNLGVADDGFSWEVTDPGSVVSCPWHGWQFDVATGVNVDDGDYRVPTYDTVVDDGTVYVTL